MGYLSVSTPLIFIQKFQFIIKLCHQFIQKKGTGLQMNFIR